MWHELIGSGFLISSLTALVQAIRQGVPALAEWRRNESKRKADAEATALVDATARAASDADTRARLAHCEESHAKRDASDAEREERNRRREIEHARDMGILRGQLALLRDQFSALQKAGPQSPEGHV